MWPRALIRGHRGRKETGLGAVSTEMATRSFRRLLCGGSWRPSRPRFDRQSASGVSPQGGDNRAASTDGYRAAADSSNWSSTPSHLEHVIKDSLSSVESAGIGLASAHPANTGSRSATLTNSHEHPATARTARVT